METVMIVLMGLLFLALLVEVGFIGGLLWALHVILEGA